MRIVCILLCIAFLLVGTGVIPHLLLMELQDKYSEKQPVEWKERNLIILLGAGTEKVNSSTEPAFFSYGRIAEALRLYLACKNVGRKCKVVISGGDPLNNGVSEAEVYSSCLVDLGADVNDLIQESRSMNTWQNAQYTSDIINYEEFQKVILVTSALHMRRSELYFSHFGLNGFPVRADYMDARISFIPTWYNFAVTDIAFHEYIGFIRYYIYNAMGWNPERIAPGES